MWVLLICAWRSRVGSGEGVGFEGKCREGNKEGRGGREVSEDCWRRDLQIYEDGSGNNLCRVIRTRRESLSPSSLGVRGWGTYIQLLARVLFTHINLQCVRMRCFLRYVYSLKHALRGRGLLKNPATVVHILHWTSPLYMQTWLLLT